jgi:hypothetical protein
MTTPLTPLPNVTLQTGVNGGSMLADTMGWPGEPVASGVLDALVLGWNLTELKGRMRIANALTQVIAPGAEASHPDLDREVARAALGDANWMASKWRGIFVQIGSTHCRRFPQSTTDHTLYQPPSGRWSDTLAYLYGPASPIDPPDPGKPPYAAIGIVPYSGTATASLNDFKLYDASRRALNALMVLYASSQDGLIANIIREYQHALIESVMSEVPGAASQNGESARCATIDALTKRAKQLLDAWESYLREQYYAGGTLPGNSIAELEGFEAGCALAGLTWDLSTATAVDECRCLQGDEEGSQVLCRSLYSSWCDALSVRNVVAAKHAISALSTTLDCSYQAVSGTVPPADPASGTSEVTPFDPDLPSNVLNVVGRTLDYWQRSLVWLGQPGPDVPRFDLSISRSLHNALIAQSNIWQGLVTGQQSLRSFAVESVMHQLMRNVAEQFEAEASARLKAARRMEVGNLVHELWPIAVVALCTLGVLLGIAAAWLVVAKPSVSSINPNGIWSLVVLAPVLAGTFGLRMARSTPSSSAAPPAENSGPGSLLGGIGAWAERTSSLLLSLWQAAYRQLRSDLAVLNHVVGVAYPLIECFLLLDNDSGLEQIKSNYGFIDTVIWSTDERREEIEGVVTAAMQPLRVLIDARTASVGGTPPSARQ